MSDFLDDRLDALRDTALPPLAEAALVRRRGEQRRRRTRVASVTAATVVVLALAGTAAALTQDRPDALRYAPAPSPTCAPADCIDEDEVSVAVPEVPTTVTAEPRDVPTEYLVSPDTAKGVTGVNGAWRAMPAQQNAFALLVVCPTADVGGRAGVHRSLTRGTDNVNNQVIDFGAREGATSNALPQVLQQLREDVGRCPSRPADSADGLATVTSRLVKAPDTQTVVVEQTSRDCDSCEALVTRWVVTGRGSYVAYLGLPGDEAPRTAAWAAAARSGLPLPALAAGFPPQLRSVENGTRVWAVFLAVSGDKIDAAKADAEGLGYYVDTGYMGCQEGARQGLGLPEGDYGSAAIYFATEALAQQFVDAYQPGVVGTVEITYMCAD